MYLLKPNEKKNSTGKNIRNMKYFEMKNTVKKTKDSVDVLNSRMENTEEIISEIGGRTR